MVDTVRTVTDLNTNLFQDGQPALSISPQRARDANLSAFCVKASVQTVSYTAVLADMGTCIEMNAVGAVNFTVPPNSLVAFPIGTVMEIFQYGAGQVTLVAGAGVTIRTPSSLTTRAQYSSISIRKRALDEWVAGGDLT